MTPTLRRKLEALAERREELQHLLSDPDVVNNNDKFRTLSRELSQLEPVAVALEDEARAKADLSAAEAMRTDPEMRELAEEEIAAAQARLEELDTQLASLLVPRDPRDDGNLFLEVRAGTGGDEAAIFAGDLFRMYARYAERQGLEGGNRIRQPRRTWRLQRGGGARGRTRRVFALEVRIRHTSRATRAGDRIAGPHPHLGGDGGDHSRSR